MRQSNVYFEAKIYPHVHCYRFWHVNNLTEASELVFQEQQQPQEDKKAHTPFSKQDDSLFISSATVPEANHNPHGGEIKIKMNTTVNKITCSMELSSPRCRNHKNSFDHNTKALPSRRRKKHHTYAADDAMQVFE